MGLKDFFATILAKKRVDETAAAPARTQVSTGAPARRPQISGTTTGSAQGVQSTRGGPRQVRASPTSIIPPNTEMTVIPLASPKIGDASQRQSNPPDRGSYDDINRPVKRDATETEIKDLVSRQSGLLTNPLNEDGLQIDREFRKLVAFFSDGTLIIDRAKQSQVGVQQVRQQIKRSGMAIRRELLVDLEVIAKIYDNASKSGDQGKAQAPASDGEASKFSTTITPRQQEVLRLIAEFAAIRASDIHITINRQYAQIRVRAGGILRNIRQEDPGEMSEIFSTAFNMASDSDSAYQPRNFQGARISIETMPLPPPVQAIRLQFNPVSNNGKYVVMRLLYENSDASTGDIDALGYSRTHLEQIARLRRLPYGINIISGPTGSGKSTTLQLSLQALIVERAGTVSVLCVEDPPEYNIAGAVQMPVVNAKGQEQRSAKFTEAISAALRSDPDIIMIGEIRDKSSTQLAFTAALTGHQVWASLHSNNAVGNLTRLRDNEVEEYKLTDPTLVTGLIGQRLVRKVCPHCSLPLKKAESENKLDAKFLSRVRAAAGEYIDFIRVPHRAGCDKCRNTGYAGRTVVAECLDPDQEFMDLFGQGAKQKAVESWLSRPGAMTMYEHAMTKLLSGECSPMDIEERMGDFSEFKASPSRRHSIMTMVDAKNIIPLERSSDAA